MVMVPIGQCRELLGPKLPRRPRATVVSAPLAPSAPRPAAAVPAAAPTRRRSLKELCGPEGPDPGTSRFHSAPGAASSWEVVSSRTAAAFGFATPTALVGHDAIRRQLVERIAAEESVPAPDAEQRVDAAWVCNHYRWIVWKLASQQRSLGAALPVDGFTPQAVLKQLHARYRREVCRGERSALLRMLEGEVLPGVHMVLCISDVDAAAATLELTDGWHSVWAQCDEPLTRQLRRRRLFVGLKLRICGAEQFREAPAPADGAAVVRSGSSPTPKLQLRANGVRRAPWHVKLGIARHARFRVSLDSLQPAAGAAPCLHLRVERIYGPLVYVRKGDSDAPGVWRTPAAHDEIQQRARLHRQEELLRARDAARGGDGGATAADAAADGSAELFGEGAEADVSTVYRVLVSDLDAGPRAATAEASVWTRMQNDSSSDGLGGILREGAACKLFGAQLDERGELKARDTSWERLRSARAPSALLLPRQCTRLKELGGLRPNEEFDTVGVLVLAGPCESEAGRQARRFRWLFLADESLQLLSVRYRRGLDEPLAKLCVGQPLAIRNSSYEMRTPFEPPAGFQHVALGGACFVHLCTADTISQHGATLSCHAPAEEPQLQQAVLRLKGAAKSPYLIEHLATMGALAAEVLRGQLQPVLPAAAEAEPLAADTPKLQEGVLEIILQNGGSCSAAQLAAQCGAATEAVQSALEELQAACLIYQNRDGLFFPL